MHFDNNKIKDIAKNVIEIDLMLFQFYQKTYQPVLNYL